MTLLALPREEFERTLGLLCALPAIPESAGPALIADLGGVPEPDYWHAFTVPALGGNSGNVTFVRDMLFQVRVPVTSHARKDAREVTLAFTERLEWVTGRCGAPTSFEPGQAAVATWSLANGGELSLLVSDGVKPRLATAPQVALKDHVPGGGVTGGRTPCDGFGEQTPGMDWYSALGW